MDVEKIWRDLCEGELSLPSSLTTSWWNRILSEYTQPYRHYHTLQHLSEFLLHFSQNISLISSPLPFLLAIFFHDIIYRPQSSTNEDESIQLFETFVHECHAVLTLPTSAYDAISAEGVAWHQRLDGISQSVIELIELTKSHQLNQAGEVSLDAQLFCDMDMAILGSSPERYCEYSQQVYHSSSSSC
jgi:predicted metal-dependent HD superfamily phosphohydrolase